MRAAEGLHVLMGDAEACCRAGKTGRHVQVVPCSTSVSSGVCTGCMAWCTAAHPWAISHGLDCMPALSSSSQPAAGLVGELVTQASKQADCSRITCLDQAQIRSNLSESC